jgi:hypothetical protein
MWIIIDAAKLAGLDGHVWMEAQYSMSGAKEGGGGEREGGGPLPQKYFQHLPGRGQQQLVLSFTLYTLSTFL